MDYSKIINSLYLVTSDLAVICLTITVSLSLYHYKRLNIPLQRLLLFLIWNLFIEIIARVLTSYKISNLPLLHIYTIGEIIFYSWFYKSLLIKHKTFQKNFWYLIIAGVSLLILNSIFFQIGGDYNSLAKTLVQVIIIGYAILYFYNLTEEQLHAHKFGKSLRLINSAILIYYSGSLFIFMCGQMLRSYPEWIKPFWAFNAALNLFFQLLILWGIWIIVYKKTPSSL